MWQVHDEFREPDGRPDRGAALRPEPRHRGLVQQLVQHQGYTVSAGEWGQEEAQLAQGPPQSMTSGFLELPACCSIPQDGGCIHSPPCPDCSFFPFSSFIGVELLYSVVFLLYHEVNRLCVYIYSLLLGPPSHPLGFLFRKEHSLFIVENPEVRRSLKVKVAPIILRPRVAVGRPRVWAPVFIPRASPISRACLAGRELPFSVPTRNTLFSCLRPCWFPESSWIVF